MLDFLLKVGRVYVFEDGEYYGEKEWNYKRGNVTVAVAILQGNTTKKKPLSKQVQSFTCRIMDLRIALIAECAKATIKSKRLICSQTTKDS